MPLDYKAFVEFIYVSLPVINDTFAGISFRGCRRRHKAYNQVEMKGALMSRSDKLLLRKRIINETVNDEFKNIA